MDPFIEIVETRLFAASVADEIVASISEAVSERKSCTLVLSGGQTPGEIYRTLTRPPRVSEIDWDKVSLYWGDERWVSHEDSQSNFHMVKETLLSHLPEAKPRVYPVDTALLSPAEGAKSYARTIRDTVKDKSGEFPVFDLVLLGMGEDGHIASLFPGQGKPPSGSDPTCFPSTSPAGIPERVTLSYEALFSARCVIFIVTGAGKAEMVKRAIEGGEPISNLPAGAFRDAKGRVTWFLDTPAAAALDRKRG